MSQETTTMTRDDLDTRLDELKRDTDDDDLAEAVAEDYEAQARVARRSTGDSSPTEAAGGDQRGSERAFTGGEHQPTSGLLSFYDRLRGRILAAVERRGGKLAPATVRALLLVPDVFILLVRLSLDRDVPASARTMIGGALAYFVLPIDLFPEAMVGGVGYLDDLVLATAVLAHAFGGELEPYARRHWSGPEDVRKVIADVAGAAQGLLGKNLYDRLNKVLAKRGIDLDAQQKTPRGTTVGEERAAAGSQGRTGGGTGGTL
ncbi:MAG TPA: DUF1232 domain-containing protein [Thermoanaerobaculia bacterium]|nr:DUF1232 domain-containing protein [Thermoanaerobaculia bacterium]